MEHLERIDSLTRNLLECYEELDLIYRLSRRGLSALDADENVGYILTEAMEIFGADMGWLFTNGPEITFRPVHVGIAPDAASAVETAIAARVIGDCKSRIFYSLKDEVGFERDGAPHSLLCTLLKTEHAVYGALCVGRSRGGPQFTAGDLKLGEVLASQAAIGLENAVLQRRRMEERESIVRLQEELRLARSIQDRLLPKAMPDLRGYEIAGASIPALSVGGDYFDFIPINHEHIALCLGDVSGKGMPAALLMAYLQAAIRGQTLLRASPADCLRGSNRLLFQSTDPERFATCFYGVLDSKRHVLRYANAGHDRPVLVSPKRDPLPLDEAGLVLGLLEDSGYEERLVSLEPGDALIVYSDGIIDAADNRDCEFGRDRFLGLVQDLRGRSASALVEAIIGEVRRHAGNAPQTDDMTLLAVRRQA